MRSRRIIREELAAALAADPPDARRVARLTAELKTARVHGGFRPTDSPAYRAQPTAPARRPKAPADPDAEAIKTWPRELRARLGRSSMSRVIGGSALDDPNDWGAKNDLRRGRR
ncbi:hypothetical protein [Streptomyces sp. NPDC048188]|uniref:hypothetical protein n=1 Tax=Streptomyces sp. NPDC048188 TaxID=3155749 RepID=UPI00342F1B9B